MRYMIPFNILLRDLKQEGLTEEQATSVIQKLLQAVQVDEEWYCKQYADVASAIASGQRASATAHFIVEGYAEGRLPFEHQVDEVWYLKAYPDVAESVERGVIASPTQHYNIHGYQTGRLANGG
jgi:hypothetical protein